ncbi:MAG: hypothetical protein KGJ06_02290 [Pseudomonadota bacterium]|nr:hypothetical protein [Pseudomonadota bacterium]
MKTLVYSKKIINYDTLLPEQLTEGRQESITFSGVYRQEAENLTDTAIHKMQYAERRALQSGVPTAIALHPESSSIAWIFETTQDNKVTENLVTFLNHHQVAYKQVHQQPIDDRFFSDVYNIIVDLHAWPERSMAMLNDPQIGEFMPQEAIDMAKQMVAARHINQTTEQRRQASR